MLNNKYFVHRITNKLKIYNNILNYFKEKRIINLEF